MRSLLKCSQMRRGNKKSPKLRPASNGGPQFPDSVKKHLSLSVHLIPISQLDGHGSISVAKALF